MCKGLWYGARGLSSLSDKTRKSNRLQMLLQKQHFLLSYLKTLSVWSGQGLSLRPPAQQTSAYPTELTGRRCWTSVEWKARFHSPRARHTLKVCILPVVGNLALHYCSWETALWSSDCGVPLFAEGYVETRKSGANCNLLSWLYYWFIT